MISKRKQINSSGVLGRKSGDVKVTVSLAEGVLAMKTQKLKKKNNKATKDALIKRKYRNRKREAEFWYLNKNMKKALR